MYCYAPAMKWVGTYIVLHMSVPSVRLSRPSHLGRHRSSGFIPYQICMKLHTNVENQYNSDEFACQNSGVKVTVTLLKREKISFIALSALFLSGYW